ncbi:MAG: hypothetical protein QUS35_06330, partial [bacterium]|nr:hypothetical protein [bacterium]
GGGFGFGSGPGAGFGFPAGGAGGFAMPADRGVVWVLDEKGRPAMEFVQTGATDGKNTEIVRSRGLSEGVKVITGLARKEKTEAAAPSGSRQRGFGGGPPPRMF